MKTLDSTEIKTLVRTTPQMYRDFNSTLSKILVVRVPGTDSHRNVKDVSIEFLNYLSRSKFEVDKK